MFIKSSTGGFLSKCYFQCALQFLRKNFEHGCDPSTFNGTFNKITITVAEDAFIKVSFPNVRSKQKKNKHTEYQGIFIPFKRQVYSKHGSLGSLASYIHLPFAAD